jgi:phosphatidylglycerophosphate synthase
MSIRRQIQDGIYKVIQPLVKFLIKAGLTPNAVTTIGLVLNIGVAVIFIMGAEEGRRGDLSYVGWAGGLILFAGLFDMLDGQVARLGNMSSTFGALYDSVLDRYSELILFLGICYYLVAHHYFLSSLFAFIALIGSMMVSYTRARAEGLGIECKDGLMQRPERVITIGVSALTCGLVSRFVGNFKYPVPGSDFPVFETISIFTIPIVLMAVLTNITAIRRLRDAKRALSETQTRVKTTPERKSVPPVGLWLLLTLVSVMCMSAAKTISPARELPPSGKAGSFFGDPQDTFPVPPRSKDLLFYLQRTPNTNTVLYELNLKKDGVPDKDDPIHPVWIRYTERRQRQELSFIQRVFAYGVKSKSIGADKYELRFVSYKKHAFYLMRNNRDQRFYVFTSIANHYAILNRIFIRINGGSMFSPNVEYIELKGTDPESGKEIMERFKV